MSDMHQTNDWKIETDDGVFIDVQKLEHKASEMQKAMIRFVIRCDNGEIRSKKTYAEFKEILNI